MALVASCGGGGDSERRPSPPPPSATSRPLSTGTDTPAQRDLVDLAARLQGRRDLPRTVSLPASSVGDEQDFSVLVLADPPSRRTARAVLRAISDHAYFFVESGSGVPDAEVQDAAAIFESTVWPQVTEAFGQPDVPGVDGDPRIAVLVAGLAGAGGYVTGQDAYPRAVLPASNEREMLYLDLAIRPLGSTGWAGLAAHELQHLVQQRHDRDEPSWVNEGLSELARQRVAGPASYRAFLDAPDTQLTDWDPGGANTVHYEASELFMTYLFEQTGGSPSALSAQPANGIEGVEAYLRGSGVARSFQELAADWAVANLLDEASGAYGYAALEIEPPPVATAAAGPHDGEVRQFAADYLELSTDDFPGGAMVSFRGEASVPVFAGQGEARGAVWWSGRGDNMDATLTRELDLTGVSTAALTYRTWFDIEEGFDFGYVEVSTDGGTTWQVLPGRHTSEDDPLGVSYGPGYTGKSGGGSAASWVDERIDLSAYAGSKVLVRFELINDDAANGPGWAIDDLAVPEAGFFDDAASDVGGWRREGFRRLAEPLAQDFELRVVTISEAPRVESVDLDSRGRATIDLAGLGSEYMKAVVVVMAATDGTTEPAGYTYDVTAPVP